MSVSFGGRSTLAGRGSGETSGYARSFVIMTFALARYTGSRNRLPMLAAPKITKNSSRTMRRRLNIAFSAWRMRYRDRCSTR